MKVSSDEYEGRRRWDKLVRDRIPEIIQASGKIAVTRCLDRDELDRALRVKLMEEAGEVNAAAKPSELLLELSDVLEVVYALAAEAGISRESLEEARVSRAEQRGSFACAVWLEETRPR